MKLLILIFSTLIIEHCSSNHYSFCIHDSVSRADSFSVSIHIKQFTIFITISSIFLPKTHIYQALHGPFSSCKMLPKDTYLTSTFLFYYYYSGGSNFSFCYSHLRFTFFSTTLINDSFIIYLNGISMVQFSSILMFKTNNPTCNALTSILVTHFS